MNDKSNILASLMGPNAQRQRTRGAMMNDKENENPNRHDLLTKLDLGKLAQSRQTDDNNGDRQRPTSGAGANRQHKLKQRFTVIRKLGKGTYGKVQLAINKQTGQEVAIKTIKKTKIENEQDLERVRREIQIMSSIEHPHIIHIYEVFENKDKIVLVMQYAPGGELYEYVSQLKVLDDAEARRLFRQIATAIYYCHQNKICHRDLKLENILLDEKNNAKLADFGLSNVFDKQRQLKTFCGSPLYASPEIVQGSPYEGPEVDCWSLGVLLYTLVYGAMPFDGSNFKRLVKQISEACYAEPKQKSQASPLIRRLLCADPLKRANILDICSDSWVNGQIPAPLAGEEQCSTGPEESGQAAGGALQSPASLLKVAQDMASLTPVRLDMLLALAPPAQAAPPPRPPLPRLDKLTSLASQHQMEVEEARATSPVASYVVRDLEARTAESESEPETFATPTAPADEPTQSGDSSERPRAETAESSASVEVEQEEPQEQLVEAAGEEKEEKKVDNNDDDDDGAAQDILMDHSKKSIVPEERASAAGGRTALDEAEQADEQPMEVLQAVKEAAQVQQEEAVAALPAQVAPAEEEVVKMEVEQELEAATAALGDKDKSEEAAAAAEEKPKKVKKKVVVRRRKKVGAKKDADAAEQQQVPPAQPPSAEEPEARGVAAGAEREESAAPERRPKTRMVRPAAKGPGKVRIPNTFQEKAETEAPPRANLESRRQSALVEEVSQRLLQQLQNAASSSSEQPSLPGVKVADKKDEFERRASLMIGALQQARGAQLQLQLGEPRRAEDEALLRSALLEADQIMRTSVESVARLAPLESSGLLKPPSAAAAATPDERGSEAHTPTAERPGGELDSEIGRRLAECVGRLSAELDAATSNQEERSDSVETIKAEQQESPKVRSSLLVQLGADARRADEPSELAPPAGPAPIARSYKKVTFTKEGACITETGKIYAAKADDGSLRRVERKSKVTHYPEEAGGARQSTEERVEERVSFGAAPQAGWHQKFASSSSARGSNLERLITPSGDLFDQFAELEAPFERPDDFDASFRRRSLFSRQSQQLGRADSNSSCSSGSTDVFDDIFDNWTGAIGMFERPSAFSSLLANQSPGLLSGSLFGRSPPRRRAPDSARCESVEPRFQSDAFAAGRHAPFAGFERPASAAGASNETGGGRRNLSGSSSLLNKMLQPGELLSRPANSLFQELELEHQQLKQRLARQHKQLWKGSQPSLFQDALHQTRIEADEQTRDIRGQHQQRRQLQQQQQAPSGGQHWQLSRPPPQQQQQEAEFRARSATSSAGRRNSEWSQEAAPADARLAGQKLDESQSSSSFLRQSTPLDAAPIRKNKAAEELPPQAARSPKTEPKQRQTTACFIELKRSSSSAQQQLQQQQQLEAAHSSHSQLALASSPGSNSSAFWEGAKSCSPRPAASTATSDELGQLHSAAGAAQRRDNEARVQDWLKEADLSSLSGGSQSSHSEAQTRSESGLGGTKLESWANLSGVSKQAAPVASLKQQQQQVRHSSSSSVQVSTRKLVSSTAHGQQQQQQEARRLVERVESAAQLAESSSSSRLKTKLASFTLREASESERAGIRTASSTSARHQAEFFESASGPLAVLATPLREANPPLQWSQAEPSSPQERAEDASSAELESQSSSSLLDQLRARGYRSMINQRLVSDAVATPTTTSSESAAACRASVATSSTVSVVKTSSSRVVVSKSQSSGAQTSRQVAQHQQQVFHAESSSTQSGALDELPSGAPQEADESQQAAAAESCAGQPQEASEQTNGQPAEEAREEEELDDDVRQAKANVRAYLDSAKETELFLKSMRREEEQFERQRHQMLMFDNLFIGAKLNGLSRKLSTFEAPTSSTLDDSAAKSAPLFNGNSWNQPISSHLNASYTNHTPSHNDHTQNGFFIPAPPSAQSVALSFEPTYTLPAGPPSSLYGTVATPPKRRGPLLSAFDLEALRRPLSPVSPQDRSPLAGSPPLQVPSTATGSFYSGYTAQTSRFQRRSRSQLGDQFANYKRNRLRPLSANLDALNGFSPSQAVVSNTYFPSASVRNRRSMSQVRYSTLDSTRYQPATSEYRSAYSGEQVHSSSRGDNQEEEPDDEELSEYRVDRYVPKVVPLGVGSSAAESRRRKQSLDRSAQVETTRDEEDWRERRSSLQNLWATSAPKGDTAEEPSANRRKSFTEPSARGDGAAPNSRLSQLEQRLEENKRRREQLLAATKTTQPEQGKSTQEAASRKSAARELSPVAQSRPMNKLSRPSRLESMEARIKRRSYCIPLADYSPDRNSALGSRSGASQRASLEKWRPQGASWTARNSLSSSDSGNALFQSLRQNGASLESKLKQAAAEED